MLIATKNFTEMKPSNGRLSLNAIPAKRDTSKLLHTHIDDAKLMATFHAYTRQED